MTAASQKHWRTEFGLDGLKSPTFFSNPSDIDAAGNSASQAHVLRRAFEDLKLDGALCHDNTPIIYFRQIDRIDANRVAAIHRTFWNQGVAPILVLITRDEVHIYSSLSEPTLPSVAQGDPAGFVQKLDRVAEKLQAFIIAVESREYFREHRHAFNPEKRVDRNLLHHLETTRVVLGEVPADRLEPETLDALLCRLVFTCYLFDREVIDRKYLELAGIREAEHLRDILGRSKRSEAKTDLYKLFKQLGQDFNGDLYSEDLDAEARQVRVEHLDILNNFFRGTDPRTRQQSFWPYEFGIIPIETISAIYEHFLKAAGEQEKKESGAFYTPRFLAELVLDLALDGVTTLLNKRFLDPACGSGIFLVGLFNRLAQEWSRANPEAAYDARLSGLTTILQTNLFGIDKNRAACMIAAFSLYLAFLDQLSPPDIRRVLKRVKVLPRLVSDPGVATGPIRCADFFNSEVDLMEKVNIIVGNPPWAKAKGLSSPAEIWSKEHGSSFPGRQIATAFVRKAPSHLEEGGKVCFVLPHGILFNHHRLALQFQSALFRSHAIDLVLNLSDYQRFLFEDSEAPAIVIRFRKEKPRDNLHNIDYWVPKTDWSVTHAELLTILPQDRHSFSLRRVLENLKDDSTNLIWKERFWATQRDWRLLDRLSLFPRLRDRVRQSHEHEGKPWTIAQGFQPESSGQQSSTSKRCPWDKDTLFLQATSKSLDLFVIESDCERLGSQFPWLFRLPELSEIFDAPHVLVTKGLHVAFSDFHVVFRHAMRGIHGSLQDRNLLMFLAAFLRSAIARYFLFHTSSNWGVSRAEVHVEELLRVPFPWPDQHDNPKRAQVIVDTVAEIVTVASKEAQADFANRQSIVERANREVLPLVEEYFDVNDIERILISDTNAIIMPSVRPTRTRTAVPTIANAKDSDRTTYMTLLCQTLNQWASKEYQVHGRAVSDAKLGVGMVVLEKTRRGQSPTHLDVATNNILATLTHLQHIAGGNQGALELVRGLKVFDKTLLYVTKPIGMRFWTRTSALNDADEIAGTLLMRPQKEGA